MKEAIWGTLIVAMGMLAILFIFLFQTLTNTDEHNMALLKETTKSAMYDALDLGTYRQYGEIRMDREKFVENFIRRFAENASLAQTYNVQIYDVVEQPPKVSVKVTTVRTGNILTLFGDSGDKVDFTISNTIDAILETPY